MRIETPKRLFTTYKWAGPLATFFIGVVLGSGALWSYLDYRNKSNVTALEQVKLEKEYYERLQVIQSEVAADLPKYVNLRDRYLGRDNAMGFNAKGYEVQNEYLVLISKLAASIERYNRLEWKLSNLEQRQPRWFVVPVPPRKPENIQLVTDDTDKKLLTVKALPEPLQTKVHKDLKVIIDERPNVHPATN